MKYVSDVNNYSRKIQNKVYSVNIHTLLQLPSKNKCDVE